MVRLFPERWEIHDIPKNASWLDVVEIEQSVFGKQCHSRRIGYIETRRTRTRPGQGKRINRY